jgi:hypothetical protein
MQLSTTLIDEATLLQARHADSHCNNPLIKILTNGFPIYNRALILYAQRHGIDLGTGDYRHRPPFWTRKSI